MRIESSNYLTALKALKSANTNSSTQLDTTTDNTTKTSSTTQAIGDAIQACPHVSDVGCCM